MTKPRPLNCVADVLARCKENNGCMEFIGATHDNGYGSIRFRGKRWLAHRVAYTLAHGEIPKHLVVKHSCDNRLCLNPDHLSSGTQKSNMLEALVRGRLIRKHGEERSDTKLRAEDVINIRSLIKTGISYKKIAKLLSLPKWPVASVVYGRTWKHL